MVPQYPHSGSASTLAVLATFYNSGLQLLISCPKSSLKRKAYTHKKFTKWFKPTPEVITRNKKPKFYDVVCKTTRFEKSPLSYLTKILNQLEKK